MDYRILYGKDMTRPVWREIDRLDRLSYEPQFCVDLGNTAPRFLKEPDQIICVMDGERAAGYLQFFPLADQMRRELLDTADRRLRDEDIRADEIETYRADCGNHIFIISAVVDPEYRDADAIKCMTEDFIRFLREKETAGYRIDSIYACVVSDGGARLARGLCMKPYKELEEGYRLFAAERGDVERLLREGYQTGK